MKGKNTFTKNESELIKKLIAEKVISSKNKQKGIRSNIRKIGFYYSDYSSSKHGYTVEDFENLVKSGNIKIVK